VDAVRASYALPGVFKPVKINNRWLFDGALVNPIPVSVCRAHGARYVIAVNLHFDMCGRGTIVPHFEPDVVEAPPEPEPEPILGKNGMAVRRLLRRQIFGKGETAPGISTVMMEAFNIVQDRIARSRLAGDPPDMMINPRLNGIGLFDFHRADELIERGKKAAQRELGDMTREIEARRRISGGAKLDALQGVS
ncbi:MAG: patatin-like phospholipase family protein, partial [Hyphomicrobium sp.]